MNLYKTIPLYALQLLFFVLIGYNPSAQNPKKISSDSLKFTAVQLTEISIRSAETLIYTENILENLISDEEIARLKLSNDSILTRIYKENEDFFNNNIESNSIRYLETCWLRIKNQKTIIENEKNQLSEILNDLAYSIEFLNDEKEIWSKTKQEIVGSGFSETLIERLDLISEKLSDALTIVSQQAEEVVESLDRSSELSIKMDIILDNLQKSIRDLKEQRLQNDYPNIFSLDYNNENLKFIEAYRFSLNTEWEELKSYLSSRTNEIIITLILLVLLLYLFYKNQILFANYQKNTENIYKRKLGVILSNPINSALIFALLSTIVIFSDRPPAFRDMVILIFIIPTIVLMRTLLDKKLIIFVYGFSVLVFLFMIFLMLPPENIIFRYNLLFVAIAEIYLIGLFQFQTLKKLTFPKHISVTLRYLGIMFLIIAIVGFISALTGNVMLSKSFLLAVNFTIMASGLLYIAVLIVKGLFISVIESSAAQNVNFIKNHGIFLKKRILQIINTATTFYILYLLLDRLSFWNKPKESFLGFLNKQIKVGEIQFSIGTVLIFFIVIYVSILVSKIIQVILEGDILDRMSLKRGMPHTISMLVRYTLITFGVFLGISATGIQLSSMTVIIGAFSVGIGFGLQNIFYNVVSGLILLFDRPIKIGDTIEVGTLIGRVTHVGIRTSNIKTFDGAEVIVPNGQLISNEVINWTLSDQQRRIEVLMSVSYNSDTNKVSELLMEVIKQHKDVMIYPQPQVLFKQLGESALNFRLLFWTESIDEWLRIQSEVTFKAFNKLKENNIEIPFPQRDLHLKSIDDGINVNATPTNNK